MLKKFLSIFEDENHILMGPNIKLLKISGLIIPNTRMKRAINYGVQFTLFSFVVTEIIEIFTLTDDVRSLLKNLKFSLVGVVNCTKIATFTAWQPYWFDVYGYIKKADGLSRKNANENDKKTLKKYTKDSRIFTYSYAFMIILTCMAVVMQPIVKYIMSPVYRQNIRLGSEIPDQIEGHWTPFDKTKMPGYGIALLWQSFITLYAGTVISSFDTNAAVIMVFFRGELELLARTCQSIFDVPEKNVIKKRIIECHRRHQMIVRYAAVFNSCLSPVLFLYTVVTSATLCASVYEITVETDSTQRALTAQYTVFGVVQLFFYCWYGNDVLYMSHLPKLSIYESSWLDNTSLRKELVILTGQLDKRISFTAGPFITLTLTSFISILKGAYSFFTLVK